MYATTPAERNKLHHVTSGRLSEVHTMHVHRLKDTCKMTANRKKVTTS